MSSSGNPITRASRTGQIILLTLWRLYGKNIARRPRTGARQFRGTGTPGSGFGLDLEHLPSTIHAGLQVDVVRTAEFARVLVLDIGGLLQGVGGPAHAAARRRGFSFRKCHGESALIAPPSSTGA